MTASKATLATLPPERATALIEAERAALRAVSGDGPVTEPYVVRLTAVRTTSPSPRPGVPPGPGPRCTMGG
ncbi:hypothetical protein [Streptomyces carpaticus]|uniref:Uncharacterized protein n=1 Tax=Streptomyces carpaticus TaxID=285558 RepID=A0ABV4ZTP5_9ACTN